MFKFCKLAAKTPIMELQIEFQTSDVRICNGSKKYFIGRTFLHGFLSSSSFTFPLLSLTFKFKILFVICYYF